eukprot:106649-Rhodomonas_salina.4
MHKASQSITNQNNAARAHRCSLATLGNSPLFSSRTFLLLRGHTRTSAHTSDRRHRTRKSENGTHERQRRRHAKTEGKQQTGESFAAPNMTVNSSSSIDCEPSTSARLTTCPPPPSARSSSSHAGWILF